MIEALFNSHLYHYVPSVIISGTALLVMLMAAFKRSHKMTSIVTCFGLIIGLYSQISLVGIEGYQTPLFTFDGMAALISSFLILVALIISLLLYQWLQAFDEHTEEYYLLLLLSVQGALVICASNHFASFFLGLELMSLSFIPMIAYQENNNKGLEAGIKYLILSSTASAFMLMAMAILYLYAGTLSIPELLGKMSEILSTNTDSSNHLIQSAAIVMLLVGITFKLSLVPGHLWAADVFEGSPLPTSALLASISKASVFVVLIRLFSSEAFNNQATIIEIITVITAASMLIGNLLGLMQRNILRLMAYSSIAHFGYILLAILALSNNQTLLSADQFGLLGSTGIFAKEAAIFYIIAYVVTIVGVFSMLMLLPNYTSIDSLTGLLWKKTAVACVLIVLLLSLAGIPLTIGFVGKFYLTIAAVNNQLWWLLAALICGSVMGLFYYLRIILIMIDKPVESSTTEKFSTLQFSHILVMLIFVSLIMGIGILPNELAEIIQRILSK